MATVGAMLALPVRADVPTKYYDVYVLAVASAPSLWMPLATARALLENAKVEMETVDNGLKVRLHWITKLGYGRDPIYTPYINTSDEASVAAPHVYWYPGVLDEGSLYEADFFDARIRTETEVLNDYDSIGNPYPTAVADQWNHCMRLPDTRDLYDDRLVVGLEDENEPPLQLLLEDMWRDPDQFRNAIFINPPRASAAAAAAAQLLRSREGSLRASGRPRRDAPGEAADPA